MKYLQNQLFVREGVADIGQVIIRGFDQLAVFVNQKIALFKDLKFSSSYIA